jgi:hypothetical protein
VGDPTDGTAGSCDADRRAARNSSVARSARIVRFGDLICDFGGELGGEPVDRRPDASAVAVVAERVDGGSRRGPGLGKPGAAPFGNCVESFDHTWYGGADLSDVRSTRAGREARNSTARSAPRWEVEGRGRVREAIRRFAGPLAELIARDANEGDTRLLVTDFLCEALGYDNDEDLTTEDLTTEYRDRSAFADFGLRIDRQLVAFVEVKRCTTRLSARHLRQVELDAVNEGVPWMILTNGQVWQIWHLTGGLPASVDLILEVDLLVDENAGVKADGLFFLSKESLRRRQIDELWRAQAATSPTVLGDVLLSDAVLDEVRNELRRRTGHNVGPKDLRELLLRNVLSLDARSAG